MAKERRCNLYDDNGRPRRMRDGTKGCFRDASACRFAHPHERDWETAQPSLPPRHDSVLDSDSDFFYSLLAHPDRRDRERDRRERDWERNKDKDRDKDKERGRERDKRPSSSLRPGSPPRRKDSAIARPSSGASSRRSTIDSGMDGGGTAKATAPSISSDQLEMARKDGKYRIKDLPRLRQDRTPSSSHRSRSSSMDKGRERGRGDLPTHSPLTTSHTPDVPSTDMPTLPPEPPKPPPMQPPPPPSQLPEVPRLPSFVSTQQPAVAIPRGPKALSVDEQRRAWHERIDLMFTSITSRRDYTKLESDLTQVRLLSTSALANNMTEVDRAKISARQVELELQTERKRKEINETIQKLVGSAFWPILRTPQILEVEKTLEEAKRHVLEVRSLLEDVKNGCAALLKASASDWTQDSERPSKRRKLEEKAVVPGQSTSGDAEDMAEDTAREVETFRDQLTELERHLIDLGNDITQRDQIISDEIELHIEARLEAEDALYPPVKEPPEVSQAEIKAVVDAKNEELVHAITVMGEEMGVLAVEVAELITKVNSLEDRCKALETENLEFKSKLAQNTLSQAKSQDVLIRRDKEIEAIAAALQAYIAQAPAGQTAGELPSAEYIIESLDSQLDGLFREKFCTTLVNIQRDVFERVQESHNHTLDTLSPKIMLLLKMVNLITARLGKSDVETVNAG